MFSTIRKHVAIAALTLAAISLTACGGKVGQVLKDANLELTDVNGDQYVSLMTELDTKSLIVSAVTIPVGNGMGQVEILSDITTQKTYLKLSFNLDKALNLPTPQYSSVLPNGTLLPIAGVDLNKVMAFDVGSKGSKVYLYVDPVSKKAIIGTAMNIASLSIGVPANMLMPFDFGTVTGVAGLYFGTQANTSGLAVFANLSSMFPAQSGFTMMKASAAPVNFVPMQLTPAQQRRVDRKLFQLSVSGRPIVLK